VGRQEFHSWSSHDNGQLKVSFHLVVSQTHLHGKDWHHTHALKRRVLFTVIFDATIIVGRCSVQVILLHASYQVATFMSCEGVCEYGKLAQKRGLSVSVLRCFGVRVNVSAIVLKERRIPDLYRT
jgi:hypothetical protein